MLKFTLTLSLVLGTFFAFAQEDAIYTITFESNWSQTTHPHASGSLPTAAHWSRLVGATHNDAVSFVQMGALASAGIEDIAELGSNTAFFNEVNAAITAGTANQSINGPDLDTAGGTIVINDLIVNQNYPLLSLASMIAPSPDWMIAVGGIDLSDGSPGTWKDEIVIDLFAYDAGTDSGIDYNSANMNTSPQEPISSLLGVVPFSSQKIGTLTISFQGILSVNDLSLSKFTMSPNPAQDFLQLENTNGGISKVLFYNTLGQVVKRYSNLTVGVLNANISDLKSGLYLVQLTDSKQNTTVKRLIKR
jgi:hypothetical protein